MPTKMRNITQYKDIIVMLGIIGIVIMMVVPLPPFFLDILLACNISFSIMLLLFAMNVARPLDFSVFPPVLLVATLFRLALNVSSTRLILLNGFAGNIILAFGSFVVGGNYVVGMVVFLILVIIQFIVITKGAERVAEVAARFTLDAMPGKQMSIDADLNAGLIGEDEARKRREEIAREADFYGAMDGASKFVKGDAIAGVIITFINVIGGLVIGVVQKGMDIDAALQRYTLLTVGDGLVSQIPALLIATATGMIVTRAASSGNLGEAFLQQVEAQPKTMAIAAGVLFAMGAVPGLPTVPFFVLAGALGFGAFRLHKKSSVPASDAKLPEADDKPEDLCTPEEALSLIKVDAVELEIGYGLIGLTDSRKGGELIKRLGSIRKQCALELGTVVPMIRVRDNVSLPVYNYVIKVRGVKVSEGEVRPGQFLAIGGSDSSEPIPGEKTKDPAFGMPAVWVSEEAREEAAAAGYAVVDAASVIITHLTQVVRENAAELLGRREVKMLLDGLRDEHSVLLDELIPHQMNLGQIQKVLQNLLREGISIRNLVTILEALADNAGTVNSTILLTERVRQVLYRQITETYLPEDGILRVVRLTPEIEEALLENTDMGDIALDPQTQQKILRSLMNEIQKLAERGHPPIILTSPSVRWIFRRLVEPFAPQLVVLSYSELDSRAQIEEVGVVRLS